jgi:class 3 adenylate cyclase
VQQPALARAQGSLASAAGESERPLVDRLVTFVSEAQDSELGRIRPFELAHRWGVDRGALLSVCLQAVVSGLLDLSWELICPSCRNPTSKLASLADLGPDGHCPMCDLGYGIDLDRSTEVTFRPARAIRPVADARYCMGSPTFVPHVVAQVVLPAHGQATMPLPAEPGRYRLFARGGLVSSVEVAPGAPAEVQVRVRERIEPGRIEGAPAGALTLLLDDDQARHAKLERLDWATLAATAHHLSLNPKWRRLFSAEVLKPGVILKVTRVALLFSDLTQSTALYSRAGDAPAFRLVQDHFVLLRGIVEKQEGTIVKTIGDAVMAAFADEEHAVRAAVAMQRAFVGFRPAYPDAIDVFLKLGVHAGPCYAVTANGLLDYFGQTVNVAARLQGKAHAGEIVAGEDLAARSEAGGWLDGARVTERFDAALKGLDQTLRAARIAL